jgi:acetolactate synthase I/II/III large subunit
MPIFDEMAKERALTFIMSRHQQGAAFMAQGLSRASLSTDDPRIGVCMATSGPGAMNLVTGIADAHMDSVPLLAITGQVPAGVIATDAFQESDVVGVMMPLTKQTYLRVAELDQVNEAIHTAAAHNGAFMVEFLCDPSEIVLPMVPAGGGINDMIVSTKAPPAEATGRMP